MKYMNNTGEVNIDISQCQQQTTHVHVWMFYEYSKHWIYSMYTQR